MSKYQFTITHWQQNSFRWAYLGQYLTYSFDFQYLDIICHALSKNEVQIWKLKKKKMQISSFMTSHFAPLWGCMHTIGTVMYKLEWAIDWLYITYKRAIPFAA